MKFSNNQQSAFKNTIYTYELSILNVSSNAHTKIINAK